ncbi:MAG TPA: hypothetical protein VFK05_13475, partial [Polyangiaceae bacterium]|nr:hypothetical protein [Polyangiaceae bacterium]
MLRRVRLCLISGISLLSIPALAAAQEASDAQTSDAAGEGKTVPANDDDDEPAQSEPKTKAKESSSAPDASIAHAGTSEAAAPLNAAERQAPEDWHVEIHGYFRAPLALGISSRPNPDTPNGPANTQISYAPNRTMDSSY